MARAATMAGTVAMALAAGAGGAGVVLAVRAPGAGDGLAAPAEAGALRGELAALVARMAALEARADRLPPLAGEPATMPVPANAPGGATAPTGAAAAESGAARGADGTASSGGSAAEGAEVSARRAAGAVPVAEGEFVELEKTVATLRKRLQRLEDASAEVDVSKLDTEELAQLGAEAFEAHQRAKGLRLYTELLARAPDHPKAGEARFQLGTMLDDDAAAARHLEQFVTRDAGHNWHPYARHYLAQRYEKLGDADRAQRTYEESLATSDHNPYFGLHTRWALAKIAEGRGDRATAERLWRQALADHGDTDWANLQGLVRQIRAKLGLPEPAPK